MTKKLKNKNLDYEVIPDRETRKQKKIKRLVALGLVTASIAATATLVATSDTVKTWLGIGTENNIVAETPEEKKIKELTEKYTTLQASYDVITSEYDKAKIELSDYKTKLLESQNLTAEQQAKLTELTVKLETSESNKNELQIELEEYKSKLLQEKELTADQKSKLLSLEEDVNAKAVTINQLNLQIEEYKLEIQILQEKLKNTISENLKFLEFDTPRGIANVTDIYKYGDTVWALNSYYVYFLNLTTGKLNSLYMPKVINTTPITCQINEKTVLMATAASSSNSYKFSITKFDLETQTYSNLPFYDEEGEEITATIKNMYGGVVNNGRMYICTGTNGGIFEVLEDRAVRISTIKNVKNFSIIDNEIYFTSTYAYKITSNNEVIQFAGESACGPYFIKDAYGNLLSYDTTSYSYYFDPTTSLFGDQMANFCNLKLVGGVLMDSLNKTYYFDPTTKSKGSTTEGIHDLIGEDSTSYYYHYYKANGIYRMSKSTGAITAIGSENKYSTTFNIDNNYYLTKDDGITVFDSTDMSISEVNNVNVLTEFKYTKSVVVNDSVAILMFDDDSPHDSIAVLNYQTNTIIKSLDFGSNKYCLIKDNYFYSYNESAFYRLNLSTLEIDKLTFAKSVDFTNKKQSQIYSAGNNLLLANVTSAHGSYLINLDSFTMSTRYGVSKNQFGDYFYSVENAQSSNVGTPCTILYDLAEDKTFITMGNLSKITIDGTDYLASSSGVYGLYYL